MEKTIKSAAVTICSLAALTLCGCVSSGTYQSKELESLELKKSLQTTKGDYSELLEKNKKLAAENDAMFLKLKKIDADIAEMKVDNEKLKLENEKLAAAVKPENLLKSLFASFNALQAENAKLKQAVTASDSAQQKKAELPVKLSPVVVKPAVNHEEEVSPQIKSSVALPKESALTVDETLVKPVAESK